MKEKLRVLLIDDDPAVHDLIRLAIERALGWDFFGASTRAQGIELTAEHRPDLVLLDYFLDKVVGTEIMGDIQATHAGARIVLLTGADAPHIADEAKAKGASGVILKPFRLLKLPQTLLELLQDEFEIDHLANSTAIPSAALQTLYTERMHKADLVTIEDYANGSDAALGDWNLVVSGRKLLRMPDENDSTRLVTSDTVTRIQAGQPVIYSPVLPILVEPGLALTMGRHERNDIMVPDVSVSDAHLAIIVEADHLQVRDLGSTNGTRVNGDTVVPGAGCALREGDLLLVGNVRLRVVSRAGVKALTQEVIAEENASSAPPPLQVALLTSEADTYHDFAERVSSAGGLVTWFAPAQLTEVHENSELVLIGVVEGVDEEALADSLRMMNPEIPLLRILPTSTDDDAERIVALDIDIDGLTNKIAQIRAGK